MNHIQATCVSVDGRGVILRGPPGSGKSDLALRLVDEGARLVADDLCALVFDRPHVIAVPPEHFSGCIEVRGLGILPVPSSGPVPVFLVCDLTLEGEVERLPDADYCDLCHVAIRLIRANPFQVSTPARIRLALRVASGDIVPVS